MKVSIIGGGGLVGSSAAVALQLGKIVREIRLVDVNQDLVAGQALDLLHGAALTADQKIVTIEGLSPDSSHPVQKAWAALDVPQCGYCQSGQIMAAVALLQSNPNPTDDDINTEMSNICRCGTYNRIRAAIKMAAGDTGEATRG